MTFNKTLLFNGCSFVAGDGAFWDEYRLENKLSTKSWEEMNGTTRTDKENEYWLDYQSNYRNKKNLPIRTANYLGCQRIDISENGNSNDSIALTTIAYLLKKNPKERKNFHVCIGWSTTDRLLMYIKSAKVRPSLCNINVHHCTGSKGFTKFFLDIQKYIDASYEIKSNEDYWLNYIKNIIMLENFLIANGITYTFFKSLGAPANRSDPPYFQSCSIELPVDNITNHENWYNFGNDLLPYANHSWCSKILAPKKMWINDTNHHPNSDAIIEFSILLGNFIKTNIHSYKNPISI